MFQFPGLAPFRVTGHDSSRVAPFGNPRMIAPVSAPRGLSQISTSFIAYSCQGIHRMPFVTYPKSLLITDMTLDPDESLHQLKSLRADDVSDVNMTR